MKQLPVLLLALGLLNMIAAIGVEFTSSVVIGLFYAVVTSTYAELEKGGVISHESLAGLWGAECAANWHVVVDRLILEPLELISTLRHIIAACFAIDGILLVFLSLLVRRSRVRKR